MTYGLSVSKEVVRLHSCFTSHTIFYHPAARLAQILIQFFITTHFSERIF